jgi:hypothetical protein
VLLSVRQSGFSVLGAAVPTAERRVCFRLVSRIGNLIGFPENQGQLMRIQRRGSNPEQRSGCPSSREERRRACRYTVDNDQAWLGWWAGQAFVNTPARILDISLSGAKMTVETVPPPDLDVWFCPHGVNPPEWIEAKQVPAKKRIFESREVRIMFRKNFHYETYKTLVYGIEARRGYELPHQVLPEEDDRDNG